MLLGYITLESNLYASTNPSNHICILYTLTRSDNLTDIKNREYEFPEDLLESTIGSISLHTKL